MMNEKWKKNFLPPQKFRTRMFFAVALSASDAALCLAPVGAAKPAKILRAEKFCYNVPHMIWIIVGLGNPGEEYTGTRHNTGRMAVEQFAKDNDFSVWKPDAKTKATVAKGSIGKNLVALVLPDTFMNKSGSAVVKYVKSVKAAEKMVVVYDDLDLAVGTMKVSFDRGSGGHKGMESVMRAVKTKKFARVRIGISPTSSAGKIKKPLGDEEVAKFILARYKQSELSTIDATFKKASQAIGSIITEGYVVAMNKFN